MDAQLSLLSDISAKLFNTTQQINALHIRLAQTVIEESISNAKQILEANDLYEVFSIAAAQAQPAVEKMRAYQQHLVHIGAGAQVELAKTAGAHVPQTNRAAVALVEELQQHATEETEKAAQRQMAAMEKLTAPLVGKRTNGRARGSRRNV